MAREELAGLLSCLLERTKAPGVATIWPNSKADCFVHLLHDKNSFR
jgi:hypothetical protein